MIEFEWGNYLTQIGLARDIMETQVLLFFLIIVLWLIGISIVLYRIYALFNKLTKGVEVGDLKKVLERVMSEEERNALNVSELTQRLNLVEENGKLHVQKVGIARFNPFKEVGGDHSFSLAILDADDTGVIITSLHTRDRTRVYMKDLKKGKSTSELSDDEKKAIAVARSRK